MIYQNATDILINILNDEILLFKYQNPLSYRPIIEKIGDASIVLIGEATHGTEEFYQARMELSKYLIQEKNFNAITIEGDWPSAYLIHQYIQGLNNETETSCLKNFKRFPTWMWANSTMPPFLKWLRNYNDTLENVNEKIGFYGLDLYSLNDSIQSILDYFKLHDPEAYKHALKRYGCFDHVAMDPQQYAYLVNSGLKKACIKEVREQFIDTQQDFFMKLKPGLSNATDLLFYTMQNTQVVKNAEHYYRALFESREATWNIRDNHMMDTLQNLHFYLEKKLNSTPKIIVWAHNSHVGDARATEMATKNEINLGQLVREQLATKSFHIGFSTHSGTVTAAYDWGDIPHTETIQSGLKGSYEELFHNLHFSDFLLFLDHKHVQHYLSIPMLQRAIGVVYHPETERMSHYYFSRVPYQFDAIIHIDHTTAVKPLYPDN